MLLNFLCNIHRTTLSDTIAVSPAGLPILKVVFCSSIETVNTLAWHDHQSLVNPSTQGRSMSVPNLDEEKQKFSDEQVMQMRNKLINLARHREVFRQLPKNQKLTLAVICMVKSMLLVLLLNPTNIFFKLLIRYILLVSALVRYYFIFIFCLFYLFHFYFFLKLVSVMAPFFHQVAVQHGISTSTYGLIFSIHPFVVFCTSPFIGQMIPTIGPKVVTSIQMQTRKLRFVSILKVYSKIYTFSNNICSSSCLSVESSFPHAAIFFSGHLNLWMTTTNLWFCVFLKHKEVGSKTQNQLHDGY